MEVSSFQDSRSTASAKRLKSSAEFIVYARRRRARLRAFKAKIAQLDPARVAQFIKSPHGLFNIRGLQQGESDSGHLGTAKNWDCPSRTCTRSDSTNARANALLLTNSATTSTAARNTGAPRRVRAAAIHQGYSPRDDDDVFCLFLQKQN